MTWNASMLLFRHQMRKWFGNDILEALIQDSSGDGSKLYGKLDCGVIHTKESTRSD